MRLSFTIPGQIGGKQRPRFSRKSGTAYTPAKTLTAEAMVRSFAWTAMKGRKLFVGPVVLSVAIFKLAPASWSKKKRAAAFYVTGRPDADNTIKLIADSFNGVVWSDDAQISDLYLTRRWIQTGAERVEITVADAWEAASKIPVDPDFGVYTGTTATV